MKLGKNVLCSTIALALGLLSGCAKNPSSPDDPFEAYNRVAFAFTQDVDHLALRPAAKVYNTITPPPVKTGVNNFFANLGELITIPNDVLQGNFRYLPTDFWRLLINSTLGIGGLFDVASHVGIPKHVETFGLTFAKWRGGKSAPYFVIPVLGPSTIQNAVGHAFSTAAQPWVYLPDDQNALTYSMLGLQVVSTRAKFLDADKLVDTAFDPYIFVRDAYMQSDLRSIENNEKYGDPKGDSEETYLDQKNENSDAVTDPESSAEPAAESATNDAKSKATNKTQEKKTVAKKHGIKNAPSAKKTSVTIKKA